MGKRMIARLGSTAVTVALNDTETARNLAARLPVRLRMYASAVGCCGPLSFTLPHDPALVHRGWSNGDVNYNPAGGWLAIFVDDEENSRRYGDQLTIGRVEGTLAPLRSLAGQLDVLLALEADSID